MNTIFLLAVLFTLTLSSCIVQRTVTDSHGNTIYSGTTRGRVHQDVKKTERDVFQKEVDLGVY